MANGNQDIDIRKQKCLEAWINNPNASFEEIADIAGVSYKTFYRYRKEEEFMNTFREMCKKRFESLEAKAIEKLSDLIDDGNFNAVKYALDGLGYSATQKIDANVDGKTDITITIE